VTIARVMSDYESKLVTKGAFYGWRHVTARALLDRTRQKVWEYRKTSDALRAELEQTSAAKDAAEAVAGVATRRSEELAEALAHAHEQKTTAEFGCVPAAVACALRGRGTRTSREPSPAARCWRWRGVAWGPCSVCCT
jgi:hypothetical protein